MTLEPWCGLTPSETIKFKTWPPLLPSPVPFCSQFFSSHHVKTHYNGFLLSDHQGGFICFFSKWPTSHLNWRPKMKPSGLPKVCIFSVSGNRGVSLNILSCSAPLYLWLCHSGVRKLGFHHWVLKSASLVHISQCCLAQEMKRQPTNT